MAEAITKAPLKKEKKEIEIDGELVVEGSNEHLVLTQEFDPTKKYMFELVSANDEREIPVFDMESKRSITTAKFKPQKNIVLTSQIVWKGQRRTIRYYDGCTSIFVDKQPKDKEVIDELKRQTNRDKYNFIYGKFGTYGDERMLLIYLNIASWNGQSEFRTRNADAIYIPSNSDVKATAESNKLDLTEKALDAAKEAKVAKMMIHASFLNIDLVDYDSSNDLTEKEIRTAYRKYALKHPEEFLESYGNKTLETKYFINKAWTKGLIDNKSNPNKASWQNGREICDISGLRTQEGIVEKIYEFSQLPDGEEFLIQLNAISE